MPQTHLMRLHVVNFHHFFIFSSLLTSCLPSSRCTVRTASTLCTTIIIHLQKGRNDPKLRTAIMKNRQFDTDTSDEYVCNLVKWSERSIQNGKKSSAVTNTSRKNYYNWCFMGILINVHARLWVQNAESPVVGTPWLFRSHPIIIEWPFSASKKKCFFRCFLRLYTYRLVCLLADFIFSTQR